MSKSYERGKSLLDLIEAEAQKDYLSGAVKVLQTREQYTRYNHKYMSMQEAMAEESKSEPTVNLSEAIEIVRAAGYTVAKH